MKKFILTHIFMYNTIHMILWFIWFALIYCNSSNKYPYKFFFFRARNDVRLFRVFPMRVNEEIERRIPLMSIFQRTDHNSVSNDYGGTPPCLIISTSFHKSCKFCKSVCSIAHLLHKLFYTILHRQKNN